MRRSLRTRGGFALTEAIVAATLLLMVIQVSWWVTAVQSVVGMRVVTGSRILDETRLIHHVVSAEVGQGREGLDWTLKDGELRLRAFRGTAYRCHDQPARGVAVAVSGYRAPDPAKDSVLVLSGDGAWSPAALVRRSRGGSAGCEELGGFQAEVWHLEPARPDLLAAAYYERGAYRFSNGAFRYRRGNGGWQPLTGEGIEVDSAELVPAGPNGVAAVVTWRGPSPLPPSFRWTSRGLR